MRTKVSKKVIVGSIVVDSLLMAGNATVATMLIVKHDAFSAEDRFVAGVLAGSNAVATLVDAAMLCNDINKLIVYNKAKKEAKAVETK